MGEEVTQYELVNFNNNDSTGCGNCNTNEGSSVDEVDKAMPSSLLQDCEEIKFIEKPHAKKLNKPPSSSSHEIIASEKSKKWFNIGFMQRNSNVSAVASNSNSNSSNGNDSCESKRNAENMKMDKHRHSWHLNDSAVVEM
ncbi:hypothetical protein PVAND_006859 [Polypedilum vanderplanki]|uniref:Uncharacterized protein n=1 Tax=Polypedilum vanderplanki TaxID=319348 RepID=A0A9J6C5H1_POLVA|nr:hypothetical protein PVAND_006859 [Polypedilum vanderplanki]